MGPEDEEQVQESPDSTEAAGEGNGDGGTPETAGADDSTGE